MTYDGAGFEWRAKQERKRKGKTDTRVDNKLF